MRKRKSERERERERVRERVIERVREHAIILLMQGKKNYTSKEANLS